MTQRSQRIAGANRRFALAQDRAVWTDLAAAEAGRGAGGPRGRLRAAAAVARQLTEHPRPGGGDGPPPLPANPPGPPAPREPPRGGGGPPPLRTIPRARAAHEYADWAAVAAGARAPLVAGDPDRTQLHLAFVILPFGYGSGGHEVVFRTIAQLEAAGHTCSLWFDDP